MLSLLDWRGVRRHSEVMWVNSIKVLETDIYRGKKDVSLLSCQQLWCGSSKYFQSNSFVKSLLLGVHFFVARFKLEE